MNTFTPTRKGSALISVLIIVMVLGFTIVGVVGVGSRDQSLSVHRIATARAFYAAEAGINMALRELALASDEDGDGIVGGISDDSNDANNPSIQGASVGVHLESSSGQTVLVSTGVAGSSRRRIEIMLAAN